MTAPATVSVSPHPLMPLDYLGRRDGAFKRKSGDLPSVILTAFLSGVTGDGAKYDDQRYRRNDPFPKYFQQPI